MAEKKITNPTSNETLIIWMYQNNPGIQFALWEEGLPQRRDELFIDGVVCDEKTGQVMLKNGQPLNLPEGFYYNDKNGLTNKHNASLYCSLKITNLENIDKDNMKYVEKLALMDKESVKKTSTSNAKTKKTKTEKVVDGAKKAGKTIKSAVTKAKDFVLGNDIGRGK